MTTAPGPGDPTLSPGALVDSDHPDVVAFADSRGEGGDQRAVAVSLYYAVRDGFRYDPYRIDLSPNGMRASRVLADGYGWCVPKAALLAAVCRARGIPARLGYADVRNHLATRKLLAVMGTDVFIWHGFTEILLDGVWWKATPAFNVELCELAGIHPLEWDGASDSIYHRFDKAGRRHMEYLGLRGSYDDIPLERMTRDLADAYPGIAAAWAGGRVGGTLLARSSWDDDIRDESASGSD